MFADQYIQIAAFIGSSFVYGVGENVQQRLSVSETVQSLMLFIDNRNFSHAFYDNLEYDELVPVFFFGGGGGRRV